MGYNERMFLTTLFTNPILFFVFAASLVLAITIHEYMHAWMADRLGDPTPRLQKRVTLNPLAHLDPLGTIAILITNFGWGRPVEFDPYNLRHPRRDSALIALAGPCSNLFLALVGAAMLRFFNIPDLPSIFLYIFIPINVSLLIFNLLPIHPLDGGKILAGILPESYAEEWDEFQAKYGLFLLLALLLPIANGVSPLARLLLPIREAVLRLLGL